MLQIYDIKWGKLCEDVRKGEFFLRRWRRKWDFWGNSGNVWGVVGNPT